MMQSNSPVLQQSIIEEHIQRVVNEISWKKIAIIINIQRNRKELIKQ